MRHLVHDSQGDALSGLYTRSTLDLVQALIVDKTAVNICIKSGHRPTFSFFLGKYPGAGW